jgi:hypothetical protein
MLTMGSGAKLTNWKQAAQGTGPHRAGGQFMHLRYKEVKIRFKNTKNETEEKKNQVNLEDSITSVRVQ